MTQSIFTCRTKWFFKGKNIDLKRSRYKCFYISFLLLILIGIVNSESYSQAPQADRLNNITPASPTATAFQKYIDYPVSHTTGIPDISIPVYQINAGSLSLPITLSYHSSGLKVDEQTGIVGLGWVLNAGGTVSRKIVNKPDEFTSFPYPYRYPGSINQDIESDFVYIANMHSQFDNSAGAPDPEYDVFYYTAGGTSGKFFLASDGVNKRKPVTIPYEPIIIKSSNGDFSSYLPAITYFEITDKNGIIYRFGKSSTNATDAIEKNQDNTTAWFIKEIYSADRSNFIKFIYGSYSRTDVHRSDMWEVTDNIADPNHYFYPDPTDPGYACYNLRNSLNGKIEQHPIEHNHVSYFTPFLTDIEFTGGTIHFEYAGVLFNDDKRLKKITVKNELGNVMKVTDLEHITAIGSDLELLSGVKSKDVTNNTNEIYNFYYNPVTISGSGPNSNAVDYWGYFNGQSTNTSLIPAFQLPNLLGSYYTTSYNNKSSNEAAAKTLMLSKIKYPTGGTTEFEYETNKANNTNVGGLRIKQMISKPSETATPIIKKYAYGPMENGQGVLLQDPSNIHNFLTLSDYSYWCPLITAILVAKFRVRTVSSDMKEGGSLNSGSPVFYSEVAEYNLNLSNETNGKTVYVYEPPVLYDFYLGASTFNTLYEEWKTNHLKTKTDYSKIGTTYTPVKREDYGYFIRENNPLKCIKVAIRKYGALGINSLWYENGPWSSSFRQWSVWNLPNNEPYSTYWTVPGEVFNIAGYEYKTGVKLLSNKTTTLYTPSGNIVTTENYTYGTDHNEPLTITTVNSKGETQIVTNKYPHDFVSQQPYTDMVNVKHIWSPIVEQSLFKDNINNLLKSAKTNFGFWNGNAWTTNSANQILPQTVELRIKNNTPETRIMFNKYDLKNNLLEQQKVGDVKEVFLWGYNNTYPVAKIVGSDFATVNSVITQSQIDAAISNETSLRGLLNILRSNVATKNAFITTYTYKLQIGITSETDPRGRTTYFEYDAFNRLSLIRDHDNNILKKICYNYAGQPENCTTACDPNLPLWQNTNTPLRCQMIGCSYTGYQEQEQIDVNSCSVPANQTRWVQVDSNSIACAVSTGVSITSQSTGISVFTAVYTKSTGQVYTFTIPAGSATLGCIPAGTYSITISKPGNAMSMIFGTGCSNMSGTIGSFKKVMVSTSNCNQINIQYDYL
jgi:YD repeat-containing protein